MEASSFRTSRSVAKHVFVCGYPRAGTTMFYNMLRTTVTNFQFLDREWPAKLAIGESPASIATKRPLDVFDADEIVAANKLGKEIICLVLIRDIRSLVTSVHKNVPADYFVGFDHQYFVHEGSASFTNPGILQIHRAIGRMQQRRDLRTRVLRYEDILCHTDAVQAHLGREVGFAYRGQFCDFHMHETPPELEYQLNNRRPIDHASIGAWQHERHRTRIRDQFTRCPALFDLLKAYGYEKDDTWFAPYRDGVKVDLS